MDISVRLIIAGTTVEHISEVEGDKYRLFCESSSINKISILAVCARTKTNRNTASNIIQFNVVFVRAQHCPAVFINLKHLRVCVCITRFTRLFLGGKLIAADI